MLKGNTQKHKLIKKRPAAYSKSRYNASLSWRIQVKLAYDGMCNLGYLTEERSGVANGPIGLYLTRYQATLNYSLKAAN